MTFDAGRIRHDGQLMHYSIGSNGLAVPSNWRLAATGDTGVAWAPESATAVSYGSNSNDVSSANAGGGSSLASRADHVHRGVRTVTAAGSNNLFGDVNLSAGTGMAITTSGQTVTFASTATGGGSVSYASNSNDVASVGAAGASTLVSRADHVHKGVTSLSHASNTFYGPVILTTEGDLGITSPTPGTYAFKAVAGSGSGGSGGAAGALVFLEAHTASASASLDFTSFISSTYDTYKIEVVELKLATDGAHLHIEMGTGGGPTYDTGNTYEWARFGLTSGGSGANDSGSSGLARLFNAITNTAGYGFGTASLTATGLQSTSLRKTIHGTIEYVNTAPAAIYAIWGMQWTTTGTAVTALRFIASSGNITSGTIRIYGVAKS